MTVATLRCKRIDRTPVLWPGSRCVGLVTRVAGDGTWADMFWAQTLTDLYDGVGWPKRQPLDRIADWEHA